MNTPTKRIFYLFGPKFAKNEPQTKVWGSLTCKLQLCSWLRTNFAADYAGCATGRRGVRARSHAPAAALQSVRRAATGYLTPAFFLARSIAAICSSESLMEP